VDGVNLKLPSAFFSIAMSVINNWICKLLEGYLLIQFRGQLLIFGAYRYHHLKLYPEDESGPQTTKKPVVVESYNEIVYPDPSENFLARVQNHPAVIVPRLPAGFNLPDPGIFLLLCLLFQKLALV
jgi:hypothetical protein